MLGEERITKIYHLADVYHSENIDQVSDDFIEDAKITEGTFDSVARTKYALPSHWDIGKVFKRLILGISKEKQEEVIPALFEAYHSFVSEKIEDFNSSFYYDAPQNILNDRYDRIALKQKIRSLLFQTESGFFLNGSAFIRSPGGSWVLKTKTCFIVNPQCS